MANHDKEIGATKSSSSTLGLLLNIFIIGFSFVDMGTSVFLKIFFRNYEVMPCFSYCYS